MSKKSRSRIIESHELNDMDLKLSKLTNKEFEDKFFTLIGKLQIRHLDVLQIASCIDPATPVKPTSRKSHRDNKIESIDENKFEVELFKLIGQYDLTHHEVIAIARGRKRRNKSSYEASNPEKTRRYINPHTGAIIVTRANAPHKLLRIWKDMYGDATVTCWLYDEYQE